MPYKSLCFVLTTLAGKSQDIREPERAKSGALHEVDVPDAEYGVVSVNSVMAVIISVASARKNSPAGGRNHMDVAGVAAQPYLVTWFLPGGVYSGRR